MKLNQEISIKSFHAISLHGVINKLIIGIGILLVIISLVQAISFYTQVNKEVPYSGGGGLINRQQIDQAYTLIQEKTIIFGDTQP